MAQPQPGRFSIAFDYIDPGSYAAFLILDESEQWVETVAALDWRPLELRTPGSGRLDIRDPTWVGMTERVVSELRQIGSEARIPDHVPLTRKAHELACHSKEYDCFDRIHRTLFRAYFESGQDIGRVDVLVRIGAEAGMDPAEVRTVLGVDRFGPTVDAERRRLLDEGVEGVPTIWSERAKIEGFRGIEAFRADLDDIFDHR